MASSIRQALIRGDHSLCKAAGGCSPDAPVLPTDSPDYREVCKILSCFSNEKDAARLLMAKESFLVEAKHTENIKYITKRIHFLLSYYMRIGFADIDWNTHAGRPVKKVWKRRNFDGINTGNNRSHSREIRFKGDKAHLWRWELLGRMCGFADSEATGVTGWLGMALSKPVPSLA